MLKARIEYLLKHYIWIQTVYKLVMSSVFKFLGLFVKIDENLVLYNSMTGKAFYDSPMAIFNYLKDNHKYAHLKHVWAFQNPESVDMPGCAKVKMDSFEYFMTALKAKYWITNVNIERGLKFKKKKTKYLNTWHGLALKYIGNAVPGRNDYNLNNIDFFCYESEHQKQIIKRDFRVREESLLPSGLPRNDELYNVTEQEVKDLKVKLGLPLDKKIILYVPTWRDSEDMGKDYVLTPPVDFLYWKKELSNDYVLLLRTHHFVTKLMNVQFDEFIRDYSSYPRINDLFKISDILISDYSACIADYSILERPIICFAYDYEEYKQKRGLYLDFNTEMPNGIKKTEKEVVAFIKNINFEQASTLTKEFKNKYTYIGGNATKICVESLFDKK